MKKSGFSVRFTNAELTLIIATLDTHEFSNSAERAVANNIIKKIYDKNEKEKQNGK